MKQLFLTALISLMLSNTYAQLSLSLNTGISVPAGSTTSLQPYLVQIEENGDRHVIPATLGGGLNVATTLGYDFNHSVGLYVTANYLKGFTGDIYQHTQLLGAPTIVTTAFTPTMWSIAPHIRVAAPKGNKKVSFYAKFGLTFNKPTVDVAITFDTSRATPLHYTAKYQKGINLGFLGGLGLDIKCTEKLSLFTALETRLFTWLPQEYMDVDEEIIEFKIKPDAHDPVEVDQQSIAFSSFSLNAGIKIKLGKEKL